MPSIDHNVNLIISIPSINEIKAHIEKHQTKYAFATGIAIYAIMKRYSAGNHDAADTVVRPFFFSLYAKNSGNTIVTTIHTGRRGHPGFPVYHPRTNTWFRNQGNAARRFGIPASVMSQHLNGIFPDAKGEVFQRVEV